MDPLSEDETPSTETVFILRTPPAQPPTAAAEPADPRPSEFIEDEQPGSSDPLHEGRPKKIIDETRRTLAVGMLLLVAAMALLPTLALILTHWTHFGTDAYRELSLVFTPVVALTSAAFGFFFASDDRNRS
ncbi:hypothetical protein ACFV3F_40075 [Streptomyces sp. NPDC059717]|uniref:hypothetical protein n=1 Tax=Streptomyces sp. NPDC059717 TaxID=3346922 RepID=UPI0036B589C0